jgi:hypothetical protein
MSHPLSYPEQENAVVGYVIAAGFRDIADPGRTRPQDFTSPLRSVIYATALALHRMGKKANALTIAQAIEDDKKLLRDAKGYAAEEGFTDWKDYLAAVDSSLSYDPEGGQTIVQYLGDIAEAAGRRKAAEIGSKLANAEIEPAEAAEALGAIQGAVAKPPPATPMLLLEGRKPNPQNTFFQGRFLCRYGAMLFVGPSGIGKSSASVQQDICWSIGREAFGLIPERPLRILHIQAENDEDDMTEMVTGVASTLFMTEADRENCIANLLTRQHSTTSGERFLNEFLRPALEADRPDIFRIDPLHAYAGCDITDTQKIGEFCREGLNPLLNEFCCGVVVNHHTPKTTNRDTSNWRASDWMYSGAGSADLTNWARAIMVIEPTQSPDAFRFIAPKRGRRLRWVNAEGESTIEKVFCHTQGKISWREASGEEAANIKPKGKDGRVSDETLLSYVPATGSISKNSLLHKWNSLMGEKKCTNALKAFISDGVLYESKKKRAGTRDEIHISREEPTLV